MYPFCRRDQGPEGARSDPRPLHARPPSVRGAPVPPAAGQIPAAAVRHSRGPADGQGGRPVQDVLRAPLPQHQPPKQRWPGHVTEIFLPHRKHPVLLQEMEKFFFLIWTAQSIQCFFGTEVIFFLSGLRKTSSATSERRSSFPLDCAKHPVLLWSGEDLLPHWPHKASLCRKIFWRGSRLRNTASFFSLTAQNITYFGTEKIFLIELAEHPVLRNEGDFLWRILGHVTRSPFPHSPHKIVGYKRPSGKLSWLLKTVSSLPHWPCKTNPCFGAVKICRTRNWDTLRCVLFSQISRRYSECMDVLPPWQLYPQRSLEKVAFFFHFLYEDRDFWYDLIQWGVLLSLAGNFSFGNNLLDALLWGILTTSVIIC